METYKKPIITDKNFYSGLFPAILAPAVAAAFVGGYTAIKQINQAMVLAKKGNSIIDSTHTSTLTTRKDFVFG